MKNRFKTVLVPLVSVSLLSVAAASYANKGGCEYRGGNPGGYGQHFGEPGQAGGYGKHFRGQQGPGAGMMAERMTRRLGLSETQQDQVREIVDASQAEREALHAKMQSNRTAIQEAMAADDIAAVQELADQKGDLVAGRIVMRANMREKIKSILTPEQQAAFAEMKGRHRPQ